MTETIENGSTQLRRVLSLSDLVLFNLVAVISLRWVAASVKGVGLGAVVLWLLAVFLFFIPQGLAVIDLSSRFPREGGIYTWTKLLLGDRHGFICGWCYWINNVLYFPTGLIRGAVVATYLIGKGDTELMNNLTYVLTFTVVSLWLATILNTVGVGTGKWLQNVGGISVYVPGTILILLGGFAVLTHAPANPLTLRGLIPSVIDYSSLNLWAAIPFAYAGLELSATMGQEIKDPSRNLPKSYYISGPLIALIYILGSISLLWLLPIAEINITAAYFPALATGASNLGTMFLWLVPLAAGASMISRVGSLGAWLSGSARVAFVVGIDRYLPAPFGRLHPRWKTPYVAILVQALIATVVLFIAILGKGNTVEHVFLILVDTSLLLYFIPYTYLFVCFLGKPKGDDGGSRTIPGGRYGRVAIGMSGLLVTIFAMIVAVIPPPGIAQAGYFTVKVLGGALLFLLVGGFIYWLANKRKQLTPKPFLSL